jgi:MFS family permease
MDRVLLPFKKGKFINTLFIANIIISIHYSLVIYVNSTFLSNFFTEGQVSALYIIGSIIDAITLINASRIMEKIGGYRFIIYAITLELLSSVGLMLSANPFLVSICFFVHVFNISLILFNLDIFLEGASDNEEETGSIRAAYMTMANICLVLSPLLLSFILRGNNYSLVYFFSSLVLIPLYYVIKNFKHFKDKNRRHVVLKETTQEFLLNKNLFGVTVTNFLLQLFYGFMVIYTPIYLTKHIGFSWSETGIIFTIMLLPFVLFELPVGELEDYKYGEKEFMVIGFVILSLTTTFMGYILSNTFWMWATILFLSRIGASFVEISTDSYFFKQVDDRRSDIISLYRGVRPIAFITAPILATISLQLIPFQYLFLVFGAIMLIGTKYALSLKDTK